MEDWIEWGAIAIYAMAIGCNFVLMARNRRLQRKLDADRAEALAERDQAIVLNALLARLCIESCQRDMLPVWKAWTRTMGSISVAVSAQTWDGEPPE